MLRLSLKQKQLNAVASSLNFIKQLAVQKKGESSNHAHALHKALIGSIVSWCDNLNQTVIPPKPVKLAARTDAELFQQLTDAKRKRNDGIFSLRSA